MRTSIIALLLIPLLCSTATADSGKASQKELGYTEYYLKEFEAEVKRAQGSANTMYRNKNEALSRVQTLVKNYPDDPAVQALYERARTALMMSKGDYQQITPAMVAYLNNEKALREKYAKISIEKWQELLRGRDIVQSVFPAVDPLKPSLENTPVDKTIVLPDVKYPDNQFVGGSGEYIVVGKPSTGFYFVNIGGREWLGAYEAIKRFRREVDASIGENLNLTVLGKVTGPVMEIPGNRRTNLAWGWVVEPEALYLDGRVLSTFDEKHEK